MNDKKSTTDTEFQELKKLLKEIPKVKAPDNFEFNLMTKIQNQNFEVKSEKKKNIFSWALTPAIAFAASVFIIVFFFNLSDDAGEDPWHIAPKLIQENVANITTNESNNITPKVVPNKVAIENKMTQSLNQYPLTKNNSINLDDDLQIPSNRIGNTGEARLAGANNGLPFDGFFIREIEKNKKIDSTSVKKDSTLTVD